MVAGVFKRTRPSHNDVVGSGWKIFEGQAARPTTGHYAVGVAVRSDRDDLLSIGLDV